MLELTIYEENGNAYDLSGKYFLFTSVAAPNTICHHRVLPTKAIAFDTIHLKVFDELMPVASMVLNTLCFNAWRPTNWFGYF